MEDRTTTGEVNDHDSLQHQIELQLEAHPECEQLTEEDELLAEYREIQRLEGALDDIAA